MAELDQPTDLNQVTDERREPSRSRSRSRSRERSPQPRDRSRSRSRSRDQRDFRRDRSRSRDRRDPRDLEVSRTIFFGNLSYNIRDRDLRDLMERYGRVNLVKVGFNQRTGQSKGYAFVEFEHRRDAEEAFYKYQDYPLDGRRLRLDWDVGYDKKARERRPAPYREPYGGGGGYQRDRRDYRDQRGYGGGGYPYGGDRGYGGGGGGGRYRSRSPPRRSPPPEYGRKRSRSPSPSDRRPEKRQRLDPR